jgi:hypothetical protein
MTTRRLKMQYYFDRNAPLYIVDQPDFDAVPVNIERHAGQFFIELSSIIEGMKDTMSRMGSPEDSAQELADLLIMEVEQMTMFQDLKTLLLEMEEEDEDQDYLT